MGGNEEKKAMMRFRKTIGITESVENAADVEGVGAEAAEAELVEKAECGVGIAVNNT